MKKRVWTVMPVYLVFVVLLFAMAFMSFSYSKVLFFVEIGVSLVALSLVLVMTLSFRKYVKRIVNDSVMSDYEVDEKYFESFKTPVVVVGEAGEILLFNKKFEDAFFEMQEPTNENIASVIPDIDLKNCTKSPQIDFSFDNRQYTAYAHKVKDGTMLTFIDNTYYKTMVQNYEDTKKSVALAVFDNFEDFAADNEEEAVRVMIKVESVLSHWATKYNLIFRKLSDNRYLIIFDEKVLIGQINKKFRILDRVRQVSYNGKNATISMGIGRNCDNLKDSANDAKKALDMALGRGGDQVAVFDHGDYEFYGGVSKGIERTNKVRVRVVAESIKDAILNCDRVLIMGHRFSDLDCIGSAVGLYSTISKRYKKPCYIVTDVDKSMAKSTIERLKKENYENEEMFISGDHAEMYAGAKTLLFVVDTHHPDFVESKEVYEKCQKIVVIDHHRKMVNHIDNAVIFFHEPTASSTCELVTELVSYLGDDNLTHDEAEAMLAGIMLDTKNFVVKTGVRTFEAAAYLRKKGADTVAVRDIFSNSLEDYKEKCKLVADAQIVRHCAITVERESIKNSRIICAQAADDLLTIQSVQASFVISKIDRFRVNISARSFGKVNVQVIMEKLGGGGHQTMAATQLSYVTLDEAKQKLINVLTGQEVL